MFEKMILQPVLVLPCSMVEFFHQFIIFYSHPKGYIAQHARARLQGAFNPFYTYFTMLFLQCN